MSFAWTGGEDGIAAALVFYRAAIKKAEVELKTSLLGDPAAKSILHVLARMGGFWDAGDYVSLERLCRLISEHEGPGSVIALNAEYLEAESIFLQDWGSDKLHFIKAAEICSRMSQRPEVQYWSKTDQAKLHFLLAFSLLQGDHVAESLPHFEAAAIEGSPYYLSGMELHILAFARAGRMDEAKQEYPKWLTRHPPSHAVERLSRQLQDVERLHDSRR